ncbi:MAG: hypothetical protein KF862_04730 [Chitinophagaceae bacterium]|nr:hypothetical protein [Chitinophagaceae bacterium]
MIEQLSAKIYLAKERGVNEIGFMRSCKTFNSGNYFNEHKTAFGNLCVLNDDTLGPGETIKMYVEEEGYIVFLPVAGGIVYNDSTGYKAAIIAGEAQIKLTSPRTVIEIENPYTDKPVNYLQIRFKPVASSLADYSEITEFNIDNGRNRLIPVTAPNAALPFTLSITKLEGRADIAYKPDNKYGGVYAYVIEGAFEVQYRLLHERDGLALWNMNGDVEAEALSNDAILLIAEVSL